MCDLSMTAPGAGERAFQQWIQRGLWYGAHDQGSGIGAGGQEQGGGVQELGEEEQAL